MTAIDVRTSETMKEDASDHTLLGGATPANHHHVPEGGGGDNHHGHSTRAIGTTAYALTNGGGPRPFVLGENDGDDDDGGKKEVEIAEEELMVLETEEVEEEGPYHINFAVSLCTRHPDWRSRWCWLWPPHHPLRRAATTTTGAEMASSSSPAGGPPPNILDLLTAVAADAASASTPTTAAGWWEAWEIQLRKQVVGPRGARHGGLALPEDAPDPDQYHWGGRFWPQLVQLCVHILYFLEEPSPPPAPEATSSSSSSSSIVSVLLTTWRPFLSKLPWIVLEDILDILPTTTYSGRTDDSAAAGRMDTATFWQQYVLPSYNLLFGPELWSWRSTDDRSNTPAPAASLAFLKLANKLVARHHVQRQLPSPPTSHHHHQHVEEKISDWSTFPLLAHLSVILAQVFPLAERSALRAWGSSHYAAPHLVAAPDDDDEDRAEEAFWATAEQFRTETGTVHNHHQHHHPTVSADYSLYQAFWKLQRDFAHPNNITVADFIIRVNQVWTYWESQEPAGRHRGARGEEFSFSPADFTPCPLDLTSSNLFPWQVKDPWVIIQVLTQFLFVHQHLTAQVPALKPQLATLEKRAGALLRQQLFSPPSTTTTNTNSTADDYCRLLQSLLQGGEPIWRRWKKNKCQPDLEKIRSTYTKPTTQVELRGQKRKRAAADRTSADLHATSASHFDDDPYQVLSLRDHVPQLAQQLRQVVPSLQAHLAEYVEALDPEAGIEAEYHPKNNPVFCWRALRLFCHHDHHRPLQQGDTSEGPPQQVSYLADLHRVRPNGDMEALVRHVYKNNGAVIPGGELAVVHQASDESGSGAMTSTADLADTEAAPELLPDGVEVKKDENAMEEVDRNAEDTVRQSDSQAEPIVEDKADVVNEDQVQEVQEHAPANDEIEGYLEAVEGDQTTTSEQQQAPQQSMVEEKMVDVEPTIADAEDEAADKEHVESAADDYQLHGDDCQNEMKGTSHQSEKVDAVNVQGDTTEKTVLPEKEDTAKQEKGVSSNTVNGSPQARREVKSPPTASPRQNRPQQQQGTNLQHHRPNPVGGPGYGAERQRMSSSTSSNHAAQGESGRGGPPHAPPYQRSHGPGVPPDQHHHHHHHHQHPPHHAPTPGQRRDDRRDFDRRDEERRGETSHRSGAPPPSRTSGGAMDDRVSNNSRGAGPPGPPPPPQLPPPSQGDRRDDRRDEDRRGETSRRGGAPSTSRTGGGAMDDRVGNNNRGAGPPGPPPPTPLPPSTQGDRRDDRRDEWRTGGDRRGVGGGGSVGRDQRRGRR